MRSAARVIRRHRRARRSESSRALARELFSRLRRSPTDWRAWIVTAVARSHQNRGAEGESNQREDHPHEQPQQAAAPGEREHKPQSYHGRRPHPRHRTFDGDRFRRQRGRRWKIRLSCALDCYRHGHPVSRWEQSPNSAIDCVHMLMLQRDMNIGVPCVLRSGAWRVLQDSLHDVREFAFEVLVCGCLPRCQRQRLP